MSTFAEALKMNVVAEPVLSPLITPAASTVAVVQQKWDRGRGARSTSAQTTDSPSIPAVLRSLTARPAALCHC